MNIWWKRGNQMVAITILAVAWSGRADAQAARRGPPSAPAKNIILFVGDGMQLQHEMAASRYLTGRNFDLSFHKFDVRGGACTTWDVTTYNRYA